MKPDSNPEVCCASLSNVYESIADHDPREYWKTLGRHGPSMIGMQRREVVGAWVGGQTLLASQKKTQHAAAKEQRVGAQMDGRSQTTSSRGRRATRSSVESSRRSQKQA